MTSRMTICRNAYPMNWNTFPRYQQRESSNTTYPVRFQMRIGTMNLEWKRRKQLTKPTSRTYRKPVVKEENKSISVQMGTEERNIDRI